ncbi:hypothetical protein D3C74_340370 [compost metagenome]
MCKQLSDLDLITNKYLRHIQIKIQSQINILARCHSGIEINGIFNGADQIKRIIMDNRFACLINIEVHHIIQERE